MGKIVPSDMRYAHMTSHKSSHKGTRLPQESRNISEKNREEQILNIIMTEIIVFGVCRTSADRFCFNLYKKM